MKPKRKKKAKSVQKLLQRQRRRRKAVEMPRQRAPHRPMPGQMVQGQIETPVSETQAVQTQAPETQAPETQASYQPVYMTVVSECYLRSTPEYGDNILTSLYSGTVVEFLDNDTGWAHVRVNGMTGYMGGRFLQ